MAAQGSTTFSECLNEPRHKPMQLAFRPYSIVHALEYVAYEKVSLLANKSCVFGLIE